MKRKTREANTRPDERIASLVNEYFDRRQAGEQLTPQRFVAEHPELADDLQPYLDGLSLLDEIRSATGSADAAVAATTPDNSLPEIEGYELLEEIGRGGMGVVYKARQIATKRTVAMKVMLAGPFASPSVQKRFEREVQLAARLNHPSIVTVLESGQVGSGQKYFAMVYADGVHLDSYVRQSEPDLRTTLELFLLVCDAVHHAHGLGVVHRDLKPANILIDSQGHPHILDFGLAKATDQPEGDESLTGQPSIPGQVLGTLRYLSPEQAAGQTEQVDVRTDVYALGVLLYEILTGEVPFDTSGKPSELIRRITDEPPVPPSAVASRVNGEVETILLKSLEKEPPRRYQSVQQMAEDVRRYLRGDPILAKRASSLYVWGKKLRKHRARIAVAAAAVALGLTGLWAGSWWSHHTLAHQQQRERREARAYIQRIQRMLEEGHVRDVGNDALQYYYDYRDLPEAGLVHAQARYEKGWLDDAIWFLEDELPRSPAGWACRALLAEFLRLKATNTEDELVARSDELDAEQARELAAQAEREREEAEALAAQAEREADLSAEGWYLRSFTTLSLEQALYYARQAVAVDPTHVLAWERAAYLALGQRDYDFALRCTRELIALQPDATEWTTLRNYIHTEQERAEPTPDEGVPEPPTSAPEGW